MSSLYDDVILDHIKDARNYEVPERPHRTGSAINPLCGDTLQVFVVLDGERIEQVAFQCECCGIAMASASIMTEWLRDHTRAEAKAIRQTFLDAVKAREPGPLEDAPADHSAILGVVRSAPGREGCAQIAWDAVADAIRDA